MPQKKYLIIINLFIFKLFEEFTITVYAVTIIVFLFFGNRKDTTEYNENEVEKNYLSSKKYLYSMGEQEIAIPAKYIENIEEKNLVFLVNDKSSFEIIDNKSFYIIFFGDNDDHLIELTKKYGENNVIVYKNMFSNSENMIKYLEEKFSYEFNIKVIGEITNAK